MMLSEAKKKEIINLLREADERRERIPDACSCYGMPQPTLEALLIDGQTAYLVECPRCGLKVGTFAGFIEAVKLWNDKIQKHYEGQ